MRLGAPLYQVCHSYLGRWIGRDGRAGVQLLRQRHETLGCDVSLGYVKARMDG